MLSDYVNTLGQLLLRTYGERVHKVAIDAGLSCPNRDGSKGIGGCTFCNNVTFSPNGRAPDPILEQIQNGREVLIKRTGAKKYIAYFQAYTNTYSDIETLSKMYETALSEDDIIGLSIGTRPDCVPDEVIDLLVDYQNKGFDIWLELGLQSAFDKTLKRINRGHGFEEYRQTLLAARGKGLRVCTHLIIGLPGENETHFKATLQRVLNLGVDGLKFHPLHVVKGTQLANDWRRGEYRPMTMEYYVKAVSDLIMMAPKDMIYHRLTGTANKQQLLAPEWCNKKWKVLNSIEAELRSKNKEKVLWN
ncbi:MAG: TIGR01212 family radical SAM protein [Candidatus Thioglobus sp.]|uniref:TIGR01212 family radical SAM protein n=1 Tax=Candidatus Thioglobus sp. TaxID=2026721 RepID=UPI001DC606D6|nr:TIGR01212 family radical SAM protein [Candidatus Thioglobus sp.]MBT3187214.1 TIGR01212 family radical SAM protein [Candidatus Thioglobus sp.]MBT3431745.1 TIGR01212 family radical SAM protein [Candidatus Thioglobus sp.]MBT4315705.1 TIGR01212 family radical SAM protein [Candidatus Thioglobus sp.]MBT6327293.1 TIGR01212 family radical SAM protein [Candidatus Thioglobus sp.]MBT7002861.1 TIGR01212 family radical SAM protein [Candidatus Thioglobus sp.]